MRSVVRRYEPPAESRMLEQGLIMPVSLEMDADSDDELEQLSEMYDQGGNDGGSNQVSPRIVVNLGHP